MKKNYFLILLLLITAVFSSTAQSKDSDLKPVSPAPKNDTIVKTIWYLGVGGNFNSTWIISSNTYGEPSLNHQFSPGIVANFNLGFDYNKHFGFKTELGFATMGEKSEGTQYGLAVDRTIKLNYFVFPVMMKYRTGGKLCFYVMAGPEFALLLSATQTYTRDGVTAPPYENPQQGLIDVSKSNIKDRYTGAALCGRIDAGVEYSASRHFMFNVGLSTLYSITDLNGYAWRFHPTEGNYPISHNFYLGLNLGLNYKF